MGRRTLIAPTDDPVTVAAGGTETLPTDASPALRHGPDDPSGGKRLGEKRTVRVAVVFDGTPPNEADFPLRVVNTVGGEEIAVGISEPRATAPGTGNAVPAGIWRIEGPLQSSSFLRVVNESGSSVTLTRAVALWEDI